jgi:predicted molibdopterin-dependent oxidoreductase YjgC
MADWELLGRVLTKLGGGTVPARPEGWFQDLATAVPAFAGLTYRSIGDGGQLVAGRVEAATR